MPSSRVYRGSCFGKLVQYCEEPLAVRGDLLQCIEQHVRADHIEELSMWLPPLILYYDTRFDTRPVPWPLTVDGVAALFCATCKGWIGPSFSTMPSRRSFATSSRCSKQWVRRCRAAFC